MGREVRMIAPGWEHPRDARGQHTPLLKGSYVQAVAEWDEEAAAWDRGEVLDYSKWPKERAFRPRGLASSETYEEYAGARPRPEEYMPEWAPSEATLLVMYESTSKGTPISPGFATPEALARWLADNGASAFGGMTASYEHWLGTARGGWAPSMVLQGGRLQSGVEALASSDGARRTLVSPKVEGEGSREEGE